MLSFWMKYLVDPNYDQRSALRSPLVMAGVCWRQPQRGAERQQGDAGVVLRAENGILRRSASGR